MFFQKEARKNVRGPHSEHLKNKFSLYITPPNDRRPRQMPAGQQNHVKTYAFYFTRKHGQVFAGQTKEKQKK